jgi:hypothetical protein
VRSFLLLLAATAFVSITTGAGCSASEEKAAVGTAGQAKRFIDDLLNGAKTANEFKLSKNAGPVAQAAVRDAEPLSELRRVLEEAPGQACDVLNITKNVASVLPKSPFRVQITAEQEKAIRRQARQVPEGVTDRVLNAARGMSESTLVEATDAACSVAQNA